jgi:hypothetical protein
VLFQWDSLDHVPLSDSYAKPPKSNRHPFDYFHVNSVQEAADGDLIVSARNTWSVYEIDHSTGAGIWQLGGKHSSFKMGPGTGTAFQHDAELNAGGLMTIFDDGGSPRIHQQSRAVLERLNTTNHSVTLVHQYDHSPVLQSAVEGSAQLLADDRLFVGWGQKPYFSEFDRDGEQIYDGRIVGANSSYRVYDYPWSGQPLTVPALAVRRGSDGVSTGYASWNGATDVSAWELLAGPSPGALKALAVVPRHGFETAIRVHNEQPYFAVEALGPHRRPLATSKTVGPVRPSSR